MVMLLNTGVPGSGKTYLMVKNFIKLFCVWCKETHLFILKDKHKDKVLISNIEGLTLQHLDLEGLMSDRCLQLANTKYIENIEGHDIEKMDDVIDEYYNNFLQEKVRWFFNKSYQVSLIAKYGKIIYLIEESQRYFDGKELGRKPWVRDVFYFFEKHRHYGVSIFCDTQHITKLAKGITVLFETETRAKPRTLSLLGEFKYNEYVDGSKVNAIPIVVKPDKRIFKAYKSMSQKEDVKTKKPILKILVFVVVMVFMSGFLLNYFKKNLGPGKAIAAENKIVESKKTSAGVNVVVVKKKEGEWFKLSFTVSSVGVTIIHPETSAIMPLKGFEYETKCQGKELFCFIPSEGG